VRRCRSADLPFGSLPNDQGVIGHPVPIVLQMAVIFAGLAILSAYWIIPSGRYRSVAVSTGVAVAAAPVFVVLAPIGRGTIRRLVEIGLKGKK
jgi:hypothetical protein